MKEIIHYGLHLLFPVIIAYLWKPINWKKNWLILISTMLIDLDHLLANPIFNPNRCSINFHPLHTAYAFFLYISLTFVYRTRLVAIGLLLHLLTDYIDCYFM